MRKLSRLGLTIKRFGESRRGNFAVMTAAISTVLMMATGFAVDYAQLTLAHSNLLNALDSAVTSTARDLTTGIISTRDARPSVMAFLHANGGTGFASAGRISLDALDVDTSARTVSAQASVNIDLAFPFFGASTRHVVVQSAAVYSDKKVEVAMILDTTGSMAGQKIVDLRTAATNAVRLLLDGQKPNNERVRVALVPYAEAVNIGGLADSAAFDEVAGGPNLPAPTDAPILAAATPRPDNCTTERKMPDGAADFSDDGPDTLRYDNRGEAYYAKVNRDDRISLKRDRWGRIVGTNCPTGQLIPLTGDEQSLLDAISGFTANGVTAGGIALQWGYYMLSPKWRAAIQNAGLGDGPAAYDSDKVAKIAILMTDGQFNTAFAKVPDGQTPQMRQGDVSRSNAENICANMKRSGVAVFTIGFDLNDPSMSGAERQEARSVLQDCASPDTPGIEHFFDAATGAELDEAFKAIIADTQRLALTR